MDSLARVSVCGTGSLIVGYIPNGSCNASAVTAKTAHTDQGFLYELKISTLRNIEPDIQPPGEQCSERAGYQDGGNALAQAKHRAQVTG
jgi:hypothetical protein